MIWHKQDIIVFLNINLYLQNLTKMKKFYNLLILSIAVFFVSGLVSGQDYEFESDLMGNVVMEAEHYSDMIQIGDIGSGTESYWDTASYPLEFSGEGGMKAVNPGSNPGAISVALTSAGYLKFNIDFTAGGTYYIWARASHASGSDDSFHAALADGDNVISQCAFINFEGVEGTNTWVWMNYSNDKAAVASVDVPAPGVFNFRVYIRERDFRIDKIILTRNAAYPTPEGIGPEETLKLSGLESLVAGKSGYLEVYPNPVTLNATISYALSKSDHISVKVYNVLGEEVTTLAEEIQKAGKHDLLWYTTGLSGRELKEGLYFINIRAGSESRTVKTILTR
jgi:hypothetical protein